MTDSNRLKVIQAAWILPISEAPLADAAIIWQNERINAVVKAQELDAFLGNRPHVLYNFPRAIVLPGFINLHTHLEYSSLVPHYCAKRQLAWSQGLIENIDSWSKEEWLSSALLGANEALNSGTTTVVDSSYTGVSAEAIAQTGLHGLIGLELFGFDENLAENSWQSWLQKYKRLQESASPTLQKSLTAGDVRITVAPHAPYTVCPGLWSKARDWADQQSIPLITHLAEMKEEFDWFLQEEVHSQMPMNQFLLFAFTRKNDNFLQLFKQLDNWRLKGLTPVAHLSHYNLLTNNLLAAHVIQVTEEDINLLQQNDVAIAHCPRSNARLGNGWSPLGKMKVAQLRVGLGTDSMASCDDLNLLNEARFAIGLHRAICPDSPFKAQEAIKSITLESARCIGLESEIGSLTPGKRANIAVFDLAKNRPSHRDLALCDPYDLLVHGCVNLKAIYIDGQSIKLNN